jgi:hypothetical protein
MRPCLVGAILIATVGCVSTNASILNPGVTYQKICPDGVQIFTSAERVRSEYYEVAILNSKGESSWTDEKQMTASQRSKAARLGANGIILGEVKEPKAGTKIIGSLFGTGAERKGSGLAIYIPADSNRVKRACSGKGQGATVAREEAPLPPTPFGVAAPTEPEPQPTPADQRPAPIPVRATGDRTRTAQGPPPHRCRHHRLRNPSGPRASRPRGHAARHPVRGRHREAGVHAGQCTTYIREMVPQNRYYYQTEAAAQADGYRRSEQC